MPPPSLPLTIAGTQLYHPMLLILRILNMESEGILSMQLWVTVNTIGDSKNDFDVRYIK